MKKRKAAPVLTVALMMGATVLSKALGMLRTMIMARQYGTGIEAQAFSEASHIPLTIFDLAFGAAVLGCFIPVYNSLTAEDGENDRFALIFFNFILLAASLLALVGILCSDLIIGLMAPALDDAVKTLASSLLRIMFPMVIFTGSTYTLVGVMQSKGRYLLPAMVSAISNGGVIVYLLFINPFIGENGIYGLAVAYLAAWFLQLLTLAFPLAASGFRFRPLLDFKNKALRRSLKMAPPIMLGSWLTPVSVLAGLYFASFIAVDGAVTVFDYSYTVFTIIAGVLTYSICNYAFPLLSKASGDEWAHTVRTGINAAAAVVLPFTGAAMLLAGQGVAVLYMDGDFSPAATAETANALRFMLIGMPAFAVFEVCSRVFYSKSLVRIPMLAALAGIIANILSSEIFVRFEALKVGAVGAGYACGMWAAALVLLIALRGRGVYCGELGGNLLKVLAASVASSAVMAAVSVAAGFDPFASGALKNIAAALIIFLPGALIYMLALKLMKVKFKL